MAALFEDTRSMDSFGKGPLLANPGIDRLAASTAEKHL